LDRRKVRTVRTIAENIVEIQARIARAAEKSGRGVETIRLVAVSKTQPVELIREALAAGIREIGENYVQEAERKWAELGGIPAARHLLGHLQRNKAGKAAALFDMVQSLDSNELARALGRRADSLGRSMDVLIEVNISGEESKTGVPPERALELAGEVIGLSGLRLCGLMGIGPVPRTPPAGPGAALETADEAAIRDSFRLLARLFERLPPECRQVLSMGMTGDYELAIAEGSTMVRVGTGIFGPRRSSG
jgi:pyridoxal phosphate enzyme (YggS family)